MCIYVLTEMTTASSEKTADRLIKRKNARTVTVRDHVENFENSPEVFRVDGEEGWREIDLGFKSVFE